MEKITVESLQNVKKRFPPIIQSHKLIKVQTSIQMMPGAFFFCYFEEKISFHKNISYLFTVPVEFCLCKNKHFFLLLLCYASLLLSNYPRWKVSAGRKHHNSGHQNDCGIKKMFLWPIKRSARIRPDKPRHDDYRNDFSSAICHIVQIFYEPPKFARYQLSRFVKSRFTGHNEDCSSLTKEQQQRQERKKGSKKVENLDSA